MGDTITAFAAFIGGTSSGKSTIAELVRDAIVKFSSAQNKEGLVTILEADMFYRDLEEVKLIQGENIIWDDPNLIDYIALYNTLIKLSKNQEVTIPSYIKDPGILDWNNTITLKPASIILVEGFLLHAVSLAESIYREEGFAVTHESSEKTKFSAGEAVIPRCIINGDGTLQPVRQGETADIEDTRAYIYEYLFGKKGLFSSGKYFVDCEEGEAIKRRVTRDYIMLDNRTVEVTVGQWDSVMAAYEKIIEPEKRKKWVVVDNTNFTEKTAARIYDISAMLMRSEHIAFNRDYANRRDGISGIKVIYNILIDKIVKYYVTEKKHRMEQLVKEYSHYLPGWLTGNHLFIEAFKSV